MTGHEIAALFRKRASNEHLDGLMKAINDQVKETTAHRSTVIVACCQILGQVVSNSGPDIAREIRSGVITLIDAYATEVAMGTGENG